MFESLRRYNEAIPQCTTFWRDRLTLRLLCLATLVTLAILVILVILVILLGKGMTMVSHRHLPHITHTLSLFCHYLGLPLHAVPLVKVVKVVNIAKAFNITKVVKVVNMAKAVNITKVVKALRWSGSIFD